MFGVVLCWIGLDWIILYLEIWRYLVDWEFEGDEGLLRDGVVELRYGIDESVFLGGSWKRERDFGEWIKRDWLQGLDWMLWKFNTIGGIGWDGLISRNWLINVQELGVGSGGEYQWGLMTGWQTAREHKEKLFLPSSSDINGGLFLSLSWSLRRTEGKEDEEGEGEGDIVVIVSPYINQEDVQSKIFSMTTQHITPNRKKK